jgi:hypothetical protein
MRICAFSLSDAGWQLPRFRRRAGSLRRARTSIRSEIFGFQAIRAAANPPESLKRYGQASTVSGPPNCYRC